MKYLEALLQDVAKLHDAAVALTDPHDFKQLAALQEKKHRAVEAISFLEGYRAFATRRAENAAEYHRLSETLLENRGAVAVVFGGDDASGKEGAK